VGKKFFFTKPIIYFPLASILFDNKHANYNFNVSNGAKAVVASGSYLQSLGINFSGEASQQSLTLTEVPKIQLVVIHDNEEPASADKFFEQVGEAIDDKLVDLMNSGEVPTITCSMENDNIMIGIEDDKVQSIVNAILNEFNLSAVCFNEAHLLKWFRGIVSKRILVRKNIWRNVRALNSFSDSAVFQTSPDENSDQCYLKVGLVDKDIQKLEAKSLSLNCASFGKVKLEPTSDQ